MFTQYLKGLNKQDSQVVLSITDTTSATSQSGTVIQRNAREVEIRQRDDIYMRAREIYFRARRQRPVRAASIF